MKYDFDTIIPRRGTNSYKWDTPEEENVLPMWVADMDFRTAPTIVEALQRRVAHGIFGYTKVPETYYDAVVRWFENRHRWRIDPRWIIYTSGVVPALSAIIKALTVPGDKVIVQTPAYNCFYSSIRNDGCELSANNLIYRDGRYSIDFDDLEAKVADPKAKILLLCNPHNPVGRVWTPEELRHIGDICLRNGVFVVADEIHCELTYEGYDYTPFASLSKRFQQNSVTCVSPSKAFNLAGLQISNLFIPNDSLRRRFKRELDAAGYSQLGIMGLVACEAAYAHGGEWYEAVLKYIKANIDYTREYVDNNIPGVHMSEHEGTYLVWLDFRDLGLSPAEQEHLIVDEAGLWLDGGSIFGKTGIGFERINVACPRATLKEALERIERAVKNLTQK